MTQRRRQYGFTLIELMLAITIGSVLIMGLAVMMQSTSKTSISQNSLTRLQEQERLVMTMLNDVVQAAGYFPNPQVNTPTTFFGTDPLFATTGQVIVGTSGGTGAGTTPFGDTITVRYATNSGDTIPNCTGASNTSGAVATYENTLEVVNNGSFGPQLTCVMNGTAYPLVSGVTGMTILYGVKTTATYDNNPDTWMTAAQVSAATAWSNVICARITVTFKNPVFTPGQPAALATVSFTRVVDIMRRAGVLA